MACARVSVIALLAALPFSQVSAEITLDGTMGPAGQLPGPNFTIAHTDGNTQGANLFHSFSVFNIDSTESATFTGPAGYHNVISRVTGGAASSIDGLFRSTVPNADMYFINPAGVVFGQNATLDVPGAFHTSTADELRFADNNVFSASNPPATVLTAASPAAFGFLGSNPAGIEVNNSRLEVQTGQGLSLVGGAISVEGTSDELLPYNFSAPSNASIVMRTNGGRLNLVSVNSPGAVPVAGPADGFASYGDISVRNAVLSTSADTSGEVYIHGGQVHIERASIVSDTVNGNGGDFTIKADDIVFRSDDARLTGGMFTNRLRAGSSGAGDTGTFRVEAHSLLADGRVVLSTHTVGTGQGGDVLLDVDHLEVRNTAYISASTEGAGRSGNHIVNAETIKLIGHPTGRSTGLDTESGWNNPSAGAQGDMLVTAKTIDIIGPRAEIGSFNGGPDRGGDLVIDADSMIMIGNGRAFIANETLGAGAGDAGDIYLNIGQFEVRSGSSVIALAFRSPGRAGDIVINSDRLVVAADGDSTTVTDIASFAIFGSGAAGDITINARSIEFLEGGMMFTSAFNSGTGGSITIAADSLLLDGGGTIYPRIISPPQTPAECGCLTVGTTHISAATPFTTSGVAGDIDITANNVTVRGGAAIEAITGSSNSGGNVTIQAGTISVDSDARIDAGSVGLGDGGNIALHTGDVFLSNGGNVVASSTSTGLAGDIFISASNSFRSDGGFVSTEALSSDGGNITINAVTMVDLLDSNITTSVGSGAGAGGNINIDPQFVIVQNSNIIANAFGGPGGNINIVAGLFLIDPSSTISASSQLGINGIINVDSPVADVTSGVTELPAEALDASTLVQAQCAAQAGGTSSLTSAGRSGLPAGPDGYLPSTGFGLATASTAAADATPIPVSVRDAIDGGQVLRLAMTGLECT